MGEYVWFVDSDDDIVLSAIDIVCKIREHRHDFIDFDLLHEGVVVNTMDLPEGEYASLRCSAPNQFLGTGHGECPFFRGHLIAWVDSQARGSPHPEVSSSVPS